MLTTVTGTLTWRGGVQQRIFRWRPDALRGNRQHVILVKSTELQNDSEKGLRRKCQSGAYTLALACFASVPRRFNQARSKCDRLTQVARSRRLSNVCGSLQAKTENLTRLPLRSTT
jgi:hypothetical protein